ncbi:hypothetical protein J6590_040729, partial [Homalodisca vitripennis]
MYSLKSPIVVSPHTDALPHLKRHTFTQTLRNTISSRSERSLEIVSERDSAIRHLEQGLYTY